MNEDSDQITLWLPKPLIIWLRERARVEDRNTSRIAARAIREYRERQEADKTVTV